MLMNKKVIAVAAAIILVLIVAIPVYGVITSDACGVGNVDHGKVQKMKVHENSECTHRNSFRHMYAEEYRGGVSNKTATLTFNGIGDLRNGEFSVNGEFTLSLHKKRDNRVIFEVVDGKITIVSEDTTLSLTVEKGIAIANLQKHTVKVIIKLSGEKQSRLILFGFWTPEGDNGYKLYLLFVLDMQGEKGVGSANGIIAINTE